MWFAALGDVQHNPWFVNFCGKLLVGSQDVIKLLEKNPFPSTPPKYIRALKKDYTFSTQNSTSYWDSKNLSNEIYLTPISLDNPNLIAFLKRSSPDLSIRTQKSSSFLGVRSEDRPWLVTGITIMLILILSLKSRFFNAQNEKIKEKTE